MWRVFPKTSHEKRSGSFLWKHPPHPPPPSISEKCRAEIMFEGMDKALR